MSHRPHPLTTAEEVERWNEVVGEDRQLIGPDPEEAILYDGCAECEGRAESLFLLVSGLDRVNLHRLWAKMKEVERDGEDDYRTFAEAKAGRHLYAAALLMERLGLYPWDAP